MYWIDIVSIVFASVTVNHLGLVKAVEKAVGVILPVVNCPKCLTFWMTLTYCCHEATTYRMVITSLAISFLASYVAIWLELIEAYIDTLYLSIYGKITTADNNYEDTAGANGENITDTMP